MENFIQQVSSKGLTGFDPGSANESEAWYINLFASLRIVSEPRMLQHYSGLELATERFRTIEESKTRGLTYDGGSI